MLRSAGAYVPPGARRGPTTEGSVRPAQNVTDPSAMVEKSENHKIDKLEEKKMNGNLSQALRSGAATPIVTTASLLNAPNVNVVIVSGKRMK